MSDYTTEDILKAMEDEGESLPPLGRKTRPPRAPHLIGGGLPGPGPKVRPWKEFQPGEDLASRDLHNVDFPPSIRKIEKYEHRVVAYLKVQGYSGIEIAEITGYAPVSIYTILKLPWVRALIVEEIKKSGRDAAHELLHASALDTIHFLIDTVQDKNVQRRDRISAAKEHLNRVYGMPNQPITYQEKVDLDTLSDEALARIAFQGKEGLS